MLQLFRQGGVIKSLMGAVVILIIAAFAFDFRSGAIAPKNLCVVEVEGACVEPSDYNALMRLVGPPGSSNKDLRKKGFTQHAVNALIERELLLREARRLGVSVSEEDLDDELATGRVHYSWPVDAPIPQALAVGRNLPTTGANETLTYLRVKNSKTGAFDFKIYKRQVQSILRMTHREFKKRQEAELIAARVRTMVTSPVRVSESEVFDAFSMEKSSATARMVAADYDWFGRFAVELSDDAVKAYAETNKDAIDEKWKSAQSKWQADCPLVSQMLFRYPAGANDEEKAAQRRRADAAQALLKRQVPFATVARFSGDSPEAKMGGFLGCLTKDSGPAAETLLAAAQALKQGAVSPILESPQGLHILQSHGTLVESEAESRGRSYIARQLALDDAAKKKAEAFAVAVIAEGQKGTPLKDATEAVRERQLDLGDVSDAQRGSLVRLALEHPKVPQMEVSRTFTRQSSPIFGVKGGVNAAELVFALEKEDDYVSKPVERYSGYSVLQLKERTLATRDEFEKDKAAMILAVKEQKRADVLSNYVSRLRDKAENVKINPDYVGNTEQGEADRQSDSG